LATPKFDRISIELSQRINDAVASAATDGTVSANARTAYINKAMFKLINDMWLAVKGDKKLFAQIFPELVVTRDISFSTATYTIASPNLDFYALLECLFTSANLLSVVRNSHEYLLIKSGKIEQLTPSATKPYVVEASRTIYALPTTTFASAAATISFIKQPLITTSGAF